MKDVSSLYRKPNLIGHRQIFFLSFHFQRFLAVADFKLEKAGSTSVVYGLALQNSFKNLKNQESQSLKMCNSSSFFKSEQHIFHQHSVKSIICIQVCFFQIPLSNHKVNLGSQDTEKWGLQGLARQTRVKIISSISSFKRMQPCLEGMQQKQSSKASYAYTYSQLRIQLPRHKPTSVCSRGEIKVNDYRKV